jgi:hypothetical protein
MAREETIPGLVDVFGRRIREVHYATCNSATDIHVWVRVVESWIQQACLGSV